jgi:hypothetical protein
VERAKGYYCIVQYTPDRARGEAANVGVLLFAPEHHFLDVELSPSDERVQRFFGGERDLDLGRIREMKASLQKRLRVEADRFGTLADLEHFVATRANEIILTPPRPVAVADPRADLASLFRDLVERPGRGVNGEAAASPASAAAR